MIMPALLLTAILVHGIPQAPHCPVGAKLKTGHWESGVVREHSCRNAEGQLHGLMIRYGPDGERVAEIPYRSGRAHRVAINWDRSGAVSSVYTWRDGLLDGPTVHWQNNGKVQVMQFVKGDCPGCEEARLVPSGPAGRSL